MNKGNNNEIPAEFKRQLTDIMCDSPTLVKLGDKQWKVKPLRMYSLERIFKVVDRIKLFDGDVAKAMNALERISADLDTTCEIVAIILCNHLFDEENCSFDTFEEMTDLMDRNDKIIAMVKQKVLLSTQNNVEEFANIIIMALSQLDFAQLFQIASSVTMYSELTTMGRKRNIETLSTVQAAGLGKWGTGSKAIQLTPSETTSTD